jgi:hypothetical protein
MARRQLPGHGRPLSGSQSAPRRRSTSPADVDTGGRDLHVLGYTGERVPERFWLVNLAYRFPLWPGQDRVYLQVLADYARVDYIQGHRLPRSNLAGVGSNASVALTKRITLVVGYRYGINAPRDRRFGGHDIDTQLEFKY